MEMPSLETFTPADLERELHSFALVIDKEGTFADETIDGIGIGRTFASRNCNAERSVEFYASRHRLPGGVVNRYLIEEIQTERLDQFPRPVVEMLDEDGDDIEEDAILTVDQKTQITFTPDDGRIMLERERVFGIDQSPVLEVPLLGGVPIYGEEVDLESEADQKLIANDYGLFVSELVLRVTVGQEQPIDPLEAMFQGQQTEAQEVARFVQEMLALIDVLRP